jgi:hypothetical protein
VKTFLRTRALDLTLVALLILGGGSMSWITSGRIVDVAGDRDRAWFGAETGDTTRRMIASTVVHNRTLHYPLLATVLRAPGIVLRRVAPAIDGRATVRLTLAVAAGAWLAGLFVMCRAIGCRSIDAILLSGIGISSAAAMFWTGAPDVAAIIAITVFPPIIAAAFAVRREVGAAAWLTTMIMSMSLSATHALTGVIAARRHHGRGATLQIVVNAVAVLIVLCSVQRLVFTSSGRLVDHDLADRPALRATLTTAPLAPIVPFVVTGMVMPVIAAQPELSTQHASLWSWNIAGGVAVVTWVLLLLIGVAASVPPPTAGLRGFLLAALAAQLALTLLLDGETFRAAMSTLPLLIGLTAVATLSAWRRTVVALVLLLVVSAGINNAQQWQRDLDLAATSGGEVHE